MIDCALWLYLKSPKRVVRLGYKVNLAAIPFVKGIGIEIKGGHYYSERVELIDGGGVVIIVGGGDENEFIDCETEAEMYGYVEEEKENGWYVLSDVMRSR